MDLPSEICDIVFSYWSPSKEVKKRVDYSASVMLILDALSDHAEEVYNHERECLINKIVTVPWGKRAYEKFEAILEARYMVNVRNKYLNNGFNKEQAWRLMMTHIRQFDL